MPRRARAARAAPRSAAPVPPPASAGRLDRRRRGRGSTGRRATRRLAERGRDATPRAGHRRRLRRRQAARRLRGVRPRGLTRLALPRRGGDERDGHATTVGSGVGREASAVRRGGKEPPPRRCGGGLDLRATGSSAVNERGRHPLGGTGAASAAQGLGGITSAAGLETSVRAVLSVRLAERCASIFCPHLCGHTVFSAQRHSNRSHACSEEHATPRDRPVTRRVGSGR